MPAVLGGERLSGEQPSRGGARRLLRKPLRALLGLLAIEAGWLLVNAAQVLHFATIQHAPCAAQAAVVLGAAVWTDRPSPVFEARLRHGLELYQSGQVQRVVLTGGLAEGDRLAEAEVGRAFMRAAGVPDEAIAIETASWTTWSNATNAAPLLGEVGAGRVAVVSDALHLRRATAMFEALGFEACPAPTPYTRYQSWRTQAPFLAREAFFLQVWQVAGR